MKNQSLARAVKLALLASSATTLSMPALAQDSDSDNNQLEEIITTGSRIKSDVSDAPRPITVMDRLDIELSGLDNVADVLRNTTFNTYGSFRERSGTSFGQVALVSLRGLGADYTAVLINGRRVPGNPITGGSSVDLNSIPLSAVERIELLTDSASAVYGADAIGGVINVIFRDEFDGAEVELGVESPERDGAETEYANFTIGSSSARSSVIFSGEFFRRDPIFDKDRFYSTVSGVDPNARSNIAGTEGVSVGGNTGFLQPFGRGAFQIGNCQGEDLYEITGTFFGVNDEGGGPANGCGFGYAARSMMTGGVERKSSFLDARYDLSPGTQAYVESRLTRSDTFGRYAPPVGFFTVGAGAPTNPIGEDFDAFHRFIGHGNRDETHNITEFDNVIGLNGAFPDSSVNFDTYLRFYTYNNRNEGDTYVIQSIIEDLALSGAYDVTNPLSQDPTHLAAVAQSSATLLRDIETAYVSAAFTLDGEAFEMPAGSVGWAAGGEWADEDYKDQYDSQREAVNIIGSAGNSAAGKRERWAVFGEMQFPLLESLEANVAVRYDDYSDFGGQTSPQVSLRWLPLDRLTFRGSYGQGFKAPNLTQLHQELSQSFNTATDFTLCRDRGIAEADCTIRTQFENFTGGNPSLSAEESDSFNFGVIWEPIDDLRVSADYFEIELSEKVNSLTVQEVIDLEFDGIAPPAGVRIVRGVPAPGETVGAIDFIEKPFANLSSQTITGFDVRFHYEFETDNIGSFSANLDYSEITEFSEITIEGEPRVEFAGVDVGYPDFQAALNLRWYNGDYTVSTTSRFIGSHGTDTRVFDSYDRHDIVFSYEAPWEGNFTLGVRNVGDEDPILENGTVFTDEALELYDVAGRTWFASYKHSF